MNIQAVPGVTPGIAPTPAGSAGSTAPGATLDPTGAEQTFIKLLVTELQSQDPTSPMDPTAMVGQMFSMNQLQQLIDINRTLSTALGAPSSSSSSSAISPTSVQSNMGASPAQAAATSPSNAAALYAQQLQTGAR
jgi:flagellar basal-body rod modification protein FlgD